MGVFFDVFTASRYRRTRWFPHRLAKRATRSWLPVQALPYLIAANAGSVGSIGAVAGNATNPGDTIFIGCGAGGSTTATGVTDSKGNKYQILASSGINASGNSAYAFACFNPVPLARGDTITVTFSAAGGSQTMVAAGVPSGYAMTDQSVSAISSATTTPSVTTSHALNQPEALFAYLVSGNAGNAPVWNAGWAQLSVQHQAASAFGSLAFELASSGNVTAGATILSANTALVMVTLAQGQAYPVITRQPGFSPKWLPHVRSRRGRWFLPGWGQVQAGSASLSGTGTLTASATVTEIASAALTGTGTLAAAATDTIPAAISLSGTGTLTASAIDTQFAAVSLAAAGTMTVTGTRVLPGASPLSGIGTLTAYAQAGPSPDALWAIYQAAVAKADKSLASWNETAIAGGSFNQTGMAYTTAYEDQIAAGNAYQTWLAAYEIWYPKSGI